MACVQYVGVPDAPAAPHVEAGVVALKSRSNDPDAAVRQSLEALRWLQAQGCTQFYFKYCSTFDSTPQGNIGPVADALAEALDAHKVIVCPAFPGTGRSVYNGHLFVNDALLSESGMQHHQLTPMTDPDIRRWLGPQTNHSVGFVPATTVLDGAEAIETALEAEHASGKRLIVVDALRDADLFEIGKAADQLPLITGGLALHLACRAISRGAARFLRRLRPGADSRENAWPFRGHVPPRRGGRLRFIVKRTPHLKLRQATSSQAYSHRKL